MQWKVKSDPENLIQIQISNVRDLCSFLYRLEDLATIKMCGLFDIFFAFILSLTWVPHVCESPWNVELGVGKRKLKVQRVSEGLTKGFYEF